MGNALEVGKKLVDLCRQGKAMEAITTLYSPNIVSIEAMSHPPMPAKLEGLAAVKGKAEWWEKNHEVHSAQVTGPWPHGDRFIVRFTYEVTPKAPLPMAGKKMTLDEAALYTVKDGKVVQEEFFYSMGG
jgi:ketosteroid isomerase-like protein